MADAKPVSTPSEPGQHLRGDDCLKRNDRIGRHNEELGLACAHTLAGWNEVINVPADVDAESVSSVGMKFIERTESI